MRADSSRARFLLPLILSAVTIFTTSLFAAPTVTVLSPGSGSNGSPIFYEAYAASASCAQGIAAMRIYTAPGVNAYTVNGAHIETFINLQPGSYNTVVQAWDNCGGVSKTAVSINVNSLAAVSVFMPNSPVGNIPNHIAASAQSPSCASGINAMRLYTANGVAPYTVHSNRLNAFTNLLPGTYTFTVQAWDNCGKVLKSSFTQTVGGQTDGYLYAVNGTRNPNGSVTGQVSEFQVNNGVLTNPNGSGTAPNFLTAGGPTFMVVDPGGWFAYVVTSGGISAYQINQTNGALVPITGSPFKTSAQPVNAADIAIDPNGNFLFITDQNLNSITVYRIDRSSGALTQTNMIFGAGQFNGIYALSTDFSGQYLYAVNLNGFSVKIFAYRIDMDAGTINAVLGSPYTVGNGSSPKAVDGFALSAVANYLYVGTQGGTGQAFGYTVNFGTGVLTPIQGSASWALDQVPGTPQSLLADNQGRYLWAPGSSPMATPPNWFTKYDILSGGDLGNETVSSNGSLLTVAIVEDNSGKYLYAHGADQNCTSNCPDVVSSYLIGSNGDLTRMTGPLSTNGAFTSVTQGVAVSRKQGD